MKLKKRKEIEKRKKKRVRERKKKERKREGGRNNQIMVIKVTYIQVNCKLVPNTNFQKIF